MTNFRQSSCAAAAGQVCNNKENTPYASSQSAPTFLLADNQDLTRDALEVYIRHLGYENIVEADNRAALSAFLHTYPEAVLILDPACFETFDLSAYQQILNRYPLLLILIITASPTAGLIHLLRDSRRIGMVLKSDSRLQIFSAIKCMLHGERYLSPEITSRLLSEGREVSLGANLTYTETEILKLISQGLTVKDIAAIRHCSTHTINSHKKNIYRKLHINSAYEATRYALRAGLADPVEYYI